MEIYDSFTINGIYIEQFPIDSTGIGTSMSNKFTSLSGTEVSLGGQSPDGIGLTIRSFYVGITQMTLVANNWQSTSVGKVNIDGSYWGHWQIV